MVTYYRALIENHNCTMRTWVISQGYSSYCLLVRYYTSNIFSPRYLTSGGLPGLCVWEA